MLEKPPLSLGNNASKEHLDLRQRFKDKLKRIIFIPELEPLPQKREDAGLSLPEGYIQVDPATVHPQRLERLFRTISAGHVHKNENFVVELNSGRNLALAW